MRVEIKIRLDERRHPHLTREKLPAIQKFPAVECHLKSFREVTQSNNGGTLAYDLPAVNTERPVAR